MIPHGADLTLISAVFGAAQGQLGALVSKWLDYKYQCKLVDDKALQDARQAKGKHFLITRRFLAISTAIYIFVGPWFAAQLGIPVFFTFSETNGVLSWLWFGATSIHLVEAHGFVIMPFQCYLASYIWSMYFGGKRV